jgi:hypothetical protein
MSNIYAEVDVDLKRGEPFQPSNDMPFLQDLVAPVAMLMSHRFKQLRPSVGLYHRLGSDLHINPCNVMLSCP